jgi:hypothetical protein
MQFAQQKNGQQMRASGTKKNGCPDFPPLQALVFFHQGYGVVMDGVGDLVAKGAREFLPVLYEIQKRIDNIHVAARSRERVRLRFMNQVELERVVVLRLRGLGNGVGNRSQLIVQRRGFDDFAFGLEFVEDLLPHLQFVVLILTLRRQRPCVSSRQEAQESSSSHEYGSK